MTYRASRRFLNWAAASRKTGTDDGSGSTGTRERVPTETSPLDVDFTRWHDDPDHTPDLTPPNPSCSTWRGGRPQQAGTDDRSKSAPPGAHTASLRTTRHIPKEDVTEHSARRDIRPSEDGPDASPHPSLFDTPSTPIRITRFVRKGEYIPIRTIENDVSQESRHLSSALPTSEHSMKAIRIRKHASKKGYRLENKKSAEKSAVKVVHEQDFGGRIPSNDVILQETAAGNIKKEPSIQRLWGELGKEVTSMLDESLDSVPRATEPGGLSAPQKVRGLVPMPRLGLQTRNRKPPESSEPWRSMLSEFSQEIEPRPNVSRHAREATLKKLHDYLKQIRARRSVVKKKPLY